MLAPELGVFGDKLPSVIFGFRLHQCQDSFLPEPSELPPCQRKQPGWQGAVHSTSRRGTSPSTPLRRGTVEGKASSHGAAQAAAPPPAAMQIVLTDRLFCSRLGEELQKTQPVFGNSLQPSLGNVKPYISMRPSLAVNALFYRGGKKCNCCV